MSCSIGIIGGGAAGFFSAVTAKQLLPDARVIIFEKTKKPLTKVEISGGGRCNVTHHLFDPKKLISFYPRGSRELLGAFHKFQPKDMWNWLNERGVSLKIEDDGRIFPTTDSSKTIIDCFLKEVAHLNIELKLQERVERMSRNDNKFILETEKSGMQSFDYIILATGSSKEGYAFAKELGHNIINPVPSLFGFNADDAYKELSGVSVTSATVSFPKTAYKAEGSILITHFGFSGPAIICLCSEISL